MASPEQDRTPSSLTCFVIGPIGNRLATAGSPDRVTYEESLRVMEEVIEPACVQNGLSPVRADGLTRAGEITEQIFHRLRDDVVVIADLTGANPNVMYELGLRHTRNKLTVQIGEFGRLPFDVNVIRTIQFSRSPVGLLNARDELAQVLEAGLAGEFDPVTATRLWAASEPTPTDPADDPPMDHGGAAGDEAEDSEPDDDGFLDVMAEAEEQQDQLQPTLEAVSACITELGELAEASAEQIARSDAAGRGMRGRLQAAARHAAGLDSIADRLEAAVDRYVAVLRTVSSGTLALIGRMEEDPEALEEGLGFAMVTRQLAMITRESMAALAGMVDSIKENARMAKVLREPSRRLTEAMARFTQTASIVDEWDRRLQALGVSQPPEGWEPEFDDENATSGADSDDGPGPTAEAALDDTDAPANADDVNDGPSPTGEETQGDSP